MSETIDFSGTDCYGTPWQSDWLSFTDGEYYHRVRKIMIDSGMGQGDAEMIIANVWETAWLQARTMK